MTVTIDEIEVADPADAWTRAGFSVDSDAVCRTGGVRTRLVGRERGTGIVGWSLRGLPPVGSVTEIDHIVLLSPNLDRTVASLVAVGVDPRRERDGELGGRPIRQNFFRFGEVIAETVGSPGTVDEGPSTLWGITYVVAERRCDCVVPR